MDSDTVSLKPIWSGMGETVLARTSLTLHLPFPPTELILFKKCPSTSIVVTSRVNIILSIQLLGNITHPASNSEVHLHTPQQKVPFSLIRCSSSNAKGAYCSSVAWGLRIYNIVESESDPLTFSKKNLSMAIPRSTYIHPPSLAKIRQRTHTQTLLEL